jgi:mono/diheme cytochrome c family protein
VRRTSERREITGIVLVIALAAARVAAAQSNAAAPTWSDGVAAIVHRECAGCHHPGGPAPMSLLSWNEARPWARSIAREVAAGVMPPWHASRAHGRFANDRRLSDEDRAALVAWVAAGSPAGDLTLAPTPPSFGAGWKIGEPDVVIELPTEVTVPASGEVPYHDYVVDPGFAEDVWVRAAEARPGNRDVVHHIIVDYVIEDPLVRRRLARSGFDGRVQGSLGGYVPGDEPLVLGDGLARLIPAGARIHFQMHYTPTGRIETDRSRLGLVLATGPPRHEVHTGIASSPFIHIPPGATDRTLRAEFDFERASVLLSMRPHLHRRGTSFEYRAHYPDGSEEILLWVPDYDFDWQTCYVLAEPKAMPAGTRLVVTGGWDNSSANPDNPDPAATVSWGEQTSDEMMIGFFEYYEEAATAE